MVMLTILTIFSIYAGAVISVIFRLNQNRVLDGRVKVALLLPFIHFIVLPCAVIFLNKKTNILSRMYLAWQMILIFPIVVATFSATISAECRKNRKCNKNIDNKSEVGKYRGVYDNISQELVFA